MKKLNIIYTAILLTFIGLSFSSCQKSFDPDSYAPKLNIGGYTSAKEIASGSLVAHWSFDDNLTDSVSTTAGVATGTTFTAGLKKQGFQGAVNSYVVSNTPEAVRNLKSFTAMLWFNSKLNTNAVGLLDIANSTAFWGNLSIFLESGGSATTGKLKIHVNNNGVDAWLGNYDLSNPWEKWNHLALAYEQTTSTFIVYLNGNKLATQTIANYGPINFKNADRMVFGTLQFQTTPSLTSATGKQDWASYHTGQLDEVRIYNKALTAEEIGSLQKLENRGK